MGPPSGGSIFDVTTAHSCQDVWMAGYSQTPLPKKLGIGPEHVVLTAGAPTGLILADLPDGARVASRGTHADIVLVFAITLTQLRDRYDKALDKIPANGAIWIAWPKKSSGVASKLDFDVVQELSLASGLVDNNVCAIDDTWSGLRFVVRKENRAAWARG